MNLTLFVFNLLLAMILGAVIGAERQWRQRMAGLRTNALVATAAAIFILCARAFEPLSAGRIAAQVVSGIGFLGAGVIMRDGMNIRGLNTAATLWCSAAIGLLCGMSLYWEAVVAVIIILCANIVLRELVQRVNQPAVFSAQGEMTRYRVEAHCHSPDEITVRTLMLQSINMTSLHLYSLRSADMTESTMEVSAEMLAHGAAQKEVEAMVCRISLEKSISSVTWRVIPALAE
ncbi:MULTISPECIES: MgtC family protein [Dickeya]|uniref:Protein MgtC n=1 Tax=Dickeya aquatica TaxID=1401087 RepID=A0A375AAT4_9GAMM|nr:MULTISPECIES: MgtC family protein [Dickeya]SLM62709.1 Mg(2+) transport ATPase protein C [Dickeya aquatica]